jgi:hypothetical protein
MACQVGVLIVSLPESCRVHTERRFFNKGEMSLPHYKELKVRRPRYNHEDMW